MENNVKTKIKPLPALAKIIEDLKKKAKKLFSAMGSLIWCIWGISGILIWLKRRRRSCGYDHEG